MLWTVYHTMAKGPILEKLFEKLLETHSLLEMVIDLMFKIRLVPGFLSCP